MAKLYGIKGVVVDRSNGNKGPHKVYYMYREGRTNFSCVFERQDGTFARDKYRNDQYLFKKEVVDNVDIYKGDDKVGKFAPYTIDSETDKTITTLDRRGISCSWMKSRGYNYRKVQPVTSAMLDDEIVTMPDGCQYYAFDIQELIDDCDLEPVDGSRPCAHCGHREEC